MINFPIILLFFFIIFSSIKIIYVVEIRNINVLDSGKIISASQIPKFSFESTNISPTKFIKGYLSDSNGNIYYIFCGSNNSFISCIPADNYESSLTPSTLNINEIIYFDDNNIKQSINFTLNITIPIYNLIISEDKFYYFQNKNNILNLSVKYNDLNSESKYYFINKKNLSEKKLITGKITNKDLSLDLSDLNEDIHYEIYYDENVGTGINIYTGINNSLILGKINASVCYNTSENIIFSIDLLYINTESNDLNINLSIENNDSNTYECECNLTSSSLICKVNADNITNDIYSIKLNNNDAILLDNTTINIGCGETINYTKSDNQINITSTSIIKQIIFKPLFSLISSYPIDCNNTTCIINSSNTYHLPYSTYSIYASDKNGNETLLIENFIPYNRTLVTNLDYSDEGITYCNKDTSNFNIKLSIDKSINNGTLINSNGNVAKFKCSDNKTCYIEDMPEIAGDFYLASISSNDSYQVVIPINISSQVYIKIIFYPDNLNISNIRPYLNLPSSLIFTSEIDIEVSSIDLLFIEKNFNAYSKNVTCLVNTIDRTKLICNLNYSIIAGGEYKINYTNCKNEYKEINSGSSLILEQNSNETNQLVLQYNDINVCYFNETPFNIVFISSNADTKMENFTGYLKGQDNNVVHFEKGTLNDKNLYMTINTNEIKDGEYIYGNIYYTLDSKTTAFLINSQNISFFFNQSYNPVNLDKTIKTQSIKYNEVKNLTFVYYKNVTTNRSIIFTSSNSSNSETLTCIPYNTTNENNSCYITLYNSNNNLKKDTYSIYERDECGILKNYNIEIYVDTGMSFDLDLSKSSNFSCTNFKNFSFTLIANGKKENATNIKGKLTNKDNEDETYEFSCENLNITNSNSTVCSNLEEPENNIQSLYISEISYNNSNDENIITSVTNSQNKIITFNSDYNPYDGSTEPYYIDFNINKTINITYLYNVSKNKTIYFYYSNGNEAFNYTGNNSASKILSFDLELDKFEPNENYYIYSSTECGDKEKINRNLNFRKMKISHPNFGYNSDCNSSISNFTIEIIEYPIKNDNNTNINAILVNENNSSEINFKCSFLDDNDLTCNNSSQINDGKFTLKQLKYGSFEAEINGDKTYFYYYNTYSKIDESSEFYVTNNIPKLCFEKSIESKTNISAYFIASSSLNISTICKNKYNNSCFECNDINLVPDRYIVGVINECNKNEEYKNPLIINDIGTCKGPCDNEINIFNFNFNDNIKESCLNSIEVITILLNSSLNDDVNNLNVTIGIYNNSSVNITYQCEKISEGNSNISINCNIIDNTNLTPGKYTLIDSKYNDNKISCIKNCTTFINYNSKYNKVKNDSEILYNLNEINNSFFINFNNNISDESIDFAKIMLNEFNINKNCKKSIDNNQSVNCTLDNQEYVNDEITYTVTVENACGEIEDPHITVKYSNSLIIGSISPSSCQENSTNITADIENNPYKDNLKDITLKLQKDNSTSMHNCTYQNDSREYLLCSINKTDNDNEGIYNINILYNINNIPKEAILKQNSKILLFYTIPEVKISPRIINLCQNNNFTINLKKESSKEGYKVSAVNDNNNSISLTILNPNDETNKMLVNVSDDDIKKICANECDTPSTNNTTHQYFVSVTNTCGTKTNTMIKLICKSDATIQNEIKSYIDEINNLSDSNLNNYIDEQFLKTSMITMILILCFI